MSALDETELYGEIAAAMGVPEGKYPVIVHTKHEDGTVSGHVFTPNGIHAANGVKVAGSKKSDEDKEAKKAKKARKVSSEDKGSEGEE